MADRREPQFDYMDQRTMAYVCRRCEFKLSMHRVALSGRGFPEVRYCPRCGIGRRVQERTGTCGPQSLSCFEARQEVLHLHQHQWATLLPRQEHANAAARELAMRDQMNDPRAGRSRPDHANAAARELAMRNQMNAPLAGRIRPDHAAADALPETRKPRSHLMEFGYPEHWTIIVGRALGKAAVRLFVTLWATLEWAERKSGWGAICVPLWVGEAAYAALWITLLATAVRWLLEFWK